MISKLTRRHFLQTSVAASTAFSFMPGSVLGANEKVNVALIGIGGRGKAVAGMIGRPETTNVVALCDVDLESENALKVIEKFPGAPRFKDFRKMFDKMADQIDAVGIAVPDHSHFPIAMLAMSLGKHVYVEKPLAHTFQEVELLMAMEKKKGVTCQMGNQGHSGNNYSQFKAWTEAGIIKDVTRVDAYMNSGRRWNRWKFDAHPTGGVAPEHMDWNNWLTTALSRDFSEYYVPKNWRGWYDFGNGALGDWGPHTLDTVHRFLKLGLPIEINAVKRIDAKKFIFPNASTLAFKFPARLNMPSVDVTWYDGKDNPPPRAKGLEEGRNMEERGKTIYTKDLVFKGGTHSDTLRIVPDSKMKDLYSKLPRITDKKSDHGENFILACKGQEKARSSFDISGPLTQVLLLGVISQRLGGRLLFDRKTKQFTNNKIANQLLMGPPPRKGWEQYYKL